MNNDVGDCSAVVNGIAPTVGDNCGVTLQTWALTGATTASSAATGINDASGQTFNVGVTTVTYYIEDAAGNSAQCNFNVTVSDNELPTITCPAPVSVNNDVGDCSAVVNGLAPTVGDNCGVTLQTWALTGATTASSAATGINDASGQTFNVGVTTVTYYIEDAAGNSAQCNFNVTVSDNELPTITCPAPVSVNNDVGVCSAVVNGIAPTVGDNCGVTLQTWALTGATTASSAATGINDASGQTFNVGVTTVTYYIEDAAGNSAQCNFNVTVSDNELPTITCPAPVSVNNDVGVCSAVVNGIAPTVGDNCGVTLQTWALTGATTASSAATGINDASGQTFNVGVTTVTYYIEDAAGNSAQCNFNVTVSDNELPTITCPAPVSVNNDVGVCSAVVNGIAPTVGDNCGVTLQTWALTGATTASSAATGINDASGQTFNVGVTTVTYYIEDAAGNSAQCNFNVTVSDNELPTITCPAPVSVNNDVGVCSAVVNGIAPTVGDNCGVTLQTWALTGATTASSAATGINDASGQTFNVGVTTVTYYIEDAAGNSAQCNFNVTVSDNELPQFTVPPTAAVCMAIDCSYDIDPSITGEVTDESDNCATGIEAIYTDTFITLGNCDTATQVIRNWSLDDGNGNITNQDQIIWINPISKVIPIVNDSVLCDSATTNIKLTSPNVFSSGSISIDYTVVATGGVYGFTTPVTGLLKGHIIEDQLINPTNTLQTVTYSISPVSPVGCLNGPAQEVVIYLNPTPKLSVSVPEEVYCDSSTVNITVNDETGNVFSENTKVYQLTTTYNAGAVEGVQPEGEYLAGVDISDDLVNLTQEVQQIDYHFKARIRDNRSGHEGSFCDQGGDTTITIWLNPTPVMSVSVADTLWCDSSMVEITVDDGLLGVLGSKVYQLTTTYDPLGVSGVQASGEYAAGTDITDDLVNLSDEVQAITYHFQPRIKNPQGTNPSFFCDGGSAHSITIYLNPTPKLSVSVPEEVYCDSSTVNITVNDETGNVFSENTKVYQLTTTYNAGAVEGVQPEGEYLAGVDISDDLVNLTQEVQQIDYHFKARIRDDRSGHEGSFCDQGGDTTITIWLNPTPVMSVSVADTLWCDSSMVEITVDDDLLGVLGSKVYQLTTTYDPLGVSGVQASGEYAAGTDITDDLVNLSDEVQAITYHFQPRIKESTGNESIFLL